MESYPEYPIRCTSCGTLIGSKVSLFKDLIASGEQREEAMNLCDLYLYCCRYSICNPTTIFQNMENRPAIRGLVDVLTVSEPDNSEEFSTNARFVACRDNFSLDNNPDRQKFNIADTLQRTSRTSRTGRVTRNVGNIGNVGNVRNVRSARNINPTQTSGDQEVRGIRGINVSNETTRKAAEQIPVNIPIFNEEIPRESPTSVGFPTINPPDPRTGDIRPVIMKDVGAGYKAAILTGRTYLAR